MLEVLRTIEILLLKRGFWIGFRNGLYQLVYDIYKMRKKTSMKTYNVGRRVGEGQLVACKFYGNSSFMLM